MGTLSTSIILSLAVIHCGFAQECSSKLNGDLLLAEPNTIWRLSSRSVSNRVAYASSPSAISLDYDYSMSSLFWSDLQTRQIYALADGASEAKVLVPAQKSWLPFSLAVEAISGKLYVADSFSGTVKLFDLRKEGNEGIAIGTNLTDIKDVEVDAYEGYLFVLDKFQILRTDLDGSNHKVLLSEFGNLDNDFANLPADLKKIIGSLIDEKLEKPVIYKKALAIADLTVDSKSKRLYWVNTQTRTIESSNYDGTGRKVHFQDKSGTEASESHSSLTLLDGQIYWADDITQQVFKIDVNNGKTHQVILKNVNPFFIKAISCATQQRISNPCNVNNGQCQHLCVLSRSSKDNFKCTCNIGYELARNGKSCAAVQDFLLFTQDDYVRGRSLNANGEISADAINPSKFQVGSASILDYDSEEGLIYYSSLYPKDQLHQVHLNNGEEKILIPDILAKSVGTFTFDWTTKNLYYFTYYYADMNSLSVLNVRNPSYSKILVYHVPILVRGIVVHPNRGLIYYAQQTDSGSTISRINTDGSGLKVLIDLGRPDSVGSLAVDYEEDRLYWAEDKKVQDNTWNIRIRHSNLDGTDIQELLELKDLQGPNSLAIKGNWVYLNTGKSILRLNKKNSNERVILVDSDVPGSLRSLKVYSHEMQSTAAGHPCANGNHQCEKFCFAVPRSNGGLEGVCGCPYGQKLAKNGRSCMNNSKEEPPFVPCKYTSFKCNKSTNQV